MISDVSDLRITGLAIWLRRWHQDYPADARPAVTFQAICAYRGQPTADHEAALLAATVACIAAREMAAADGAGRAACIAQACAATAIMHVAPTAGLQLAALTDKLNQALAEAWILHLATEEVPL